MSKQETSFDKDAKNILSFVQGDTNKRKGFLPTEKRSEFSKMLVSNMGEEIRQLTSLRTPNAERLAVDLTFAEFMAMRYGFACAENGAPEGFFDAIGLNTATTTIMGLQTMPDFDSTYRWLIPEVIREAIKLGLNKAPMWRQWVVSEEVIAMPTQTMPWINQSAATPAKIKEGETIPFGTVSFGQKTVKTYELGTGIEITDNVRQFVPLNVLSLFLGDVGIKLNLGLDGAAIDVLVNGDQADGSQAAPVIGSTSGTAIAYDDLLRAWIRMGRIGRMPEGMIMGEDLAIAVLGLAEFKGFAGQSTTQKLQVQTPIPATQKVWVTGMLPNANYAMLIDPSTALIKLNSMPMKVEEQRNAQNRTSAWFVSLGVGFANMMRDGRVIIQANTAYSGAPFPAWMDVDAFEVANSTWG